MTFHFHDYNLKHNLILLKCFSEYYNQRSHQEQLKVTDPDDGKSRYFAIRNRNGQWYRVEPMETRMGESLLVNVKLDVHNSSDCI